MRLWSIHPQYLDTKGLVALWREGLLAKKVLEGQTRGYRNHPQLIRFKNNYLPVEAIANYLYSVADEAIKRGYKFDITKLSEPKKVPQIEVTEGQLDYEVSHLKRKLRLRSMEKYKELCTETFFIPHPLFKVVPGEIEIWEKI